jgi:hypothetical protein
MAPTAVGYARCCRGLDQQTSFSPCNTTHFGFWNVQLFGTLTSDFTRFDKLAEYVTSKTLGTHLDT